MSDNSFILENPEDLIGHIFSDRLGEYPVSKIELGDGFNITIKLEGDQWQGGMVDYHLAQYVITLQKDLVHAYNELTGQNYRLSPSRWTYEPIAVRVRVTDCCSWLDIILTPGLKEFFKNMSGKQKTFLACAVIIAILSAYGGNRYLTHLTEQGKLNIEKNPNRS